MTEQMSLFEDAKKLDKPSRTPARKTTPPKKAQEELTEKKQREAVEESDLPDIEGAFKRKAADCELSEEINGIYICTMCDEPCVWESAGHEVVA